MVSLKDDGEAGMDYTMYEREHQLMAADSQTRKEEKVLGALDISLTKKSTTSNIQLTWNL
jgi:hypothetical protein